MAAIVNRLNYSFLHQLELNFVLRRLTIRNISNSKSGISHESSSHNSFIKVYELPKIKVLRLINRFKLYHTALTAFTIPLSIYISSNVDAGVLSVAAIGLGGCLIFYGSGQFLNNLIGAVYVNKTTDTVMLSYINFWGKRIDKICPVDDIVPLSNQPLHNTIFKLSKIQFSSSPLSLLIASESGIIFDPHAFDEVFFRVISNSQKQNIHSLQSLGKGALRSK